MQKMQPMIQTQVEALRQTAAESSPRDAAMIALMTHHFIRASEVAALKISDVNLTAGTIKIVRLKGSVPTVERIRQGERKTLEAWLASRTSGALLFPGRNGNAMSRQQVYNIFHGLCIAANVPATSAAPHASRHTLGQTLANNGVDIKKIQIAAGHKSLNSTGQYFTFSQAVVDDVMENMLQGRAA